MAIEGFKIELANLLRPIGEAQRIILLNTLRGTPTDIDSRRGIPLLDPVSTRGSYFHQLQDLVMATMVHSGVARKGNNRENQACFVKDGEAYLADNKDIEPEMHDLFELVLRVGASADWVQDRELVVSLHRVYWDLDDRVLQPWLYS